MIRIGVLLFEGFEELDALGPWDVLRTAAGAGAPFEVILFSPDERQVVVGGKGLRLHLPAGPPPKDLQWIIVPGGGWASRGATGTWAEIQRGVLPELLRQEHARGVSVASVCTGAMLVAAAGLVRGRPAVTHAVARAALAEAGAHVVDARVVDDGDLVTAAGVTSGIDLALWLTARLASAALAKTVATEMEYAGTGQIHHGPRSPAHGGAVLAGAPP